VKTAWVRTTLGEIAEIVSGATPTTSVGEYWGGGIPWVTPKELNGLEGPSIASTERTLTEAGMKSCAASLLPPQSVLLSSRAPIGLVAINDVSMATNQGFKSLVPDGDRVDAKFLYWWLRCHRARLEAMGNGATFKEVSKKVVDGVAIDLPPTEEQRRIAAVLDAAETLRTKRRQALTKLDELPRAVFHEVFGDPVRNERGWPLHTLRDVCLKIQIGPFGSLLHKSDYVEGGIPLVNPMHIVGGTIRPHRRQTISLQKYAQLEAYCMEVGDVVMGRRGEMGRVAIVGECEAGFLCGSGSLYLRPDPDSVTSPYIAAALSSARGRRRLENSAQGVTMLNLNSEIVGGFELGLPPIELQREFSTTLMAQGELKAGLRGHATALDTLFASLQQRAFRGEL